MTTSGTSTHRHAEIRSLTGLRGVAAGYVVLYHMHLFELCSGATATVLTHGYLAVDLFFVLSGFVMALTYGSLFEGGFSASQYRDFLGRRIARVYPLYAVVTVVSYLLNQLRHTANEPRTIVELAANLLLVQSWGICKSLVGPGWSISAEWAAYLIFPLLVVVCLFRGRRWSVAAAVLALMSLVLIAAAPASLIHVARQRGPMDIADPTGYSPVLRCVAEFTLGILSWRTSRLPAMESKWLPTVVCAALLMLLAVRGSDIAIVLLLPIFIGSLSHEGSPVAKALGSSPFRWLGQISYSLYLVHTLCPNGKLHALRFLTLHHVPHPSMVISAGYLMLTLAIAQATYRLIERPGRELLRRALESTRLSPIALERITEKLRACWLIVRGRCPKHDVEKIPVETGSGTAWSTHDFLCPVCENLE
jgi:peptidoglycan/LPS O-acetylase OafA/YrhL